MSWLILLLAVVAVSFAEEVKVQPGCRFKGNVYQNAETWTEKSAFRMRCIVEPNGSWRTEVSGCITPAGLEVPTNTTKSDGGMDWICESGPDGNIYLKQQTGRTADCAEGHKHGEKWVVKSFEFECVEGGVTKLLGCIAPNGQKIPEGDIQEVNGYKMQCKKDDEGNVALQSLPKEKNADCVGKDNVPHHNGDTWMENTIFEYKCEDFGQKTIKARAALKKGCVVKDQGLQIPINETRTAGNIQFHCEMKDGAYRFYTSPKA